MNVSMAIAGIIAAATCVIAGAMSADDARPASQFRSVLFVGLSIAALLAYSSPQPKEAITDRLCPAAETAPEDFSHALIECIKLRHGL